MLTPIYFIMSYRNIISTYAFLIYAHFSGSETRRKKGLGGICICIRVTMQNPDEKIVPVENRTAAIQPVASTILHCITYLEISPVVCKINSETGSNRSATNGLHSWRTIVCSVQYEATAQWWRPRGIAIPAPYVSGAGNSQNSKNVTKVIG